MPYNPQPGDALTALDTPSMIVDLDLMEANIAKLTGRLLPTGVSIRPHLKTTKSAALARRLAAAGCKGGCVAKLGEAEVLTAAGFPDLLITCPVVGGPKVARLAELFVQNPLLRIVVDDADAASAIDAALAAAGARQPIATLVDVDVGLHRTGVQPGAPAAALARHVGSLQHLRLIGVQGYEGHLQHVHSRAEREEACRASMAQLVSSADAVRAAGFDISVVTTGGTGTAEVCASVAGVTEVQPGSFIFMDTDYRNALCEGDPALYGNSLTLLSGVVSRQGERIVTIDAGLKSLTTDSGLAECKDCGPGAYEYGVLGDEQGSLAWTEEDERTGKVKPLRVGDRVEMIPSHIDPTINLHDVYYAYRKGVIEEIWKVDTRGKVQ